MRNTTKLIGISLTALCLSLGGNASAGEHGHHAHWSYTGDTNPCTWGHLKEEFHACKDGKKQSPIDISNATATQMNDIEFHYQSFPLSIINNGHTVQANSAAKSYIVVDGKKYTLLQFHFHTPSEHTVNGKHADVEAHFVHKSDDGKLAVIGIFLNKGTGFKELAKVWKNVPEKTGHAETVEGVTVDPSALLPSDRTYYRYSGSLTTPPCSEDVLWMVMKNTKTISAESYGTFHNLYEFNNRPVQPINGRKITLKK